MRPDVLLPRCGLMSLKKKKQFNWWEKYATSCQQLSTVNTGKKHMIGNRRPIEPPHSTVSWAETDKTRGSPGANALNRTRVIGKCSSGESLRLIYVHMDLFSWRDICEFIKSKLKKTSSIKSNAHQPNNLFLKVQTNKSSRSVHNSLINIVPQRCWPFPCPVKCLWRTT